LANYIFGSSSRMGYLLEHPPWKIIMSEEEVEKLRILLGKYFHNEFDFMRRCHDLVYKQSFQIEEQNPTILFKDIIFSDHPYHLLCQRLKEDLMDEIRSVFILQQEDDRFTRGKRE